MDVSDSGPGGSTQRLERTLSLFETTLGGIGIILGAGIYALVGAVAAEAGNGLWLSFLLAGAIAVTIGLCYAELASMFPKAGADYEYSRQALGPRVAFVVGWLMAIGSIIAAAAVALGFGGYLRLFVDIDIRLAAVAALAVATLISFAGIKRAMWVSIGGTFVEIAGLALVIGIGIPHFGELELAEFNKGAGGVLGGASLVMFAFIGFSQIATLAEEAENASEMIPKAMFLSIAVTTLLYVLVALAAVAVLGWEALAGSSAPLADVASDVLGANAADAVAVVALFSTANTMLLLIVAASRLIYGMASVDALPRFLAWIDPRRRAPARAVFLTLVLASAFAATGRLSFVASSTNFAVFVGFGAVCLSLLVLRRRAPDFPRPFRVPLQVAGIPLAPVAGLGLTALMMASLERDVLLVGAALFVSGLVAMEALSLWRPDEG